MTTIAAKFSTGEIAADSMVSGDDHSPQGVCQTSD
jgi:hypothetical protein